MYYIQTVFERIEFDDLAEAIKHFLKIEKDHKNILLMEYAWTKKFVDISLVEIHRNSDSYVIIGNGGMLVKTSYDNLIDLLSRVYKFEKTDFSLEA